MGASVVCITAAASRPKSEIPTAAALFDEQTASLLHRSARALLASYRAASSFLVCRQAVSLPKLSFQSH
jgi:hypothetical protein